MLGSAAVSLLSFLIGRWTGIRQTAPVVSALGERSQECECLYEGCSPKELSEHVSVLQELAWWKGLFIYLLVTLLAVAVTVSLWAILCFQTLCCCFRIAKRDKAPSVPAPPAPQPVFESKPYQASDVRHYPQVIPREREAELLRRDLYPVAPPIHCIEDVRPLHPKGLRRGPTRPSDRQQSWPTA